MEPQAKGRHRWPGLRELKVSQMKNSQKDSQSSALSTVLHCQVSDLEKRRKTQRSRRARLGQALGRE